MPRRVALPGAQELFRTTEPAFDPGPRPSGRVKHDEKITAPFVGDMSSQSRRGRTTMVWGAGKSYPVSGEDFAYQIFRKRNCCAGAY